MFVSFLRVFLIVVDSISIMVGVLFVVKRVINRILEFLGKSVVLRKLFLNNEVIVSVLFIVDVY